jgi:hypothetical protein
MAACAYLKALADHTAKADDPDLAAGLCVACAELFVGTISDWLPDAEPRCAATGEDRKNQRRNVRAPQRCLFLALDWIFPEKSGTAWTDNLVGGQDLPGEILTPLYQISGSLSQTLSDIWLPCQISDGPPHTGTDIRRQAGPRYLHGQHSLPDIWKGGRDLKLDILTPLCQISASSAPDI